MSLWHERKIAEERLRRAVNETEPGTLQTWQRRWKRTLERAGYVSFKAVGDYAGNCVYCGEAGRCPGWHIYDGRMAQVAETQQILRAAQPQEAGR